MGKVSIHMCVCVRVYITQLDVNINKIFKLSHGVCPWGCERAAQPNWLLVWVVSSAISEIIYAKTTTEPPNFGRMKTEQKVTPKNQMYKYPMFFLLNMNRCFECAMETWERLFGALVPKHPAHRRAVSLPHTGHTKADGLGPEGREPGEMSKAECRSPNRRIEAQIGILSKASFLGLVCLSAVYSIDTEWCYPIFMDTFYFRQPGTSLPPHSRDPPQHTAFPPQHLGGCEDTKKKVHSPAGMQEVPHLWDPMEVQAVLRQLESALE